MGCQDIKVQNILGATLANLIVSREVPLSPAIYKSNIATAKDKAAPVEWWPVEPVIANASFSGMTTKAPHLHAALLFLNCLHSEEEQQVVIKGGLGSPREGIGSSGRAFRKIYLEAQYPPEELEKNFSKWESLLRRHFIKKG